MCIYKASLYHNIGPDDSPSCIELAAPSQTHHTTAQPSGDLSSVPVGTASRTHQLARLTLANVNSRLSFDFHPLLLRGRRIIRW
jgi:hypothetical protein